MSRKIVKFDHEIRESIRLGVQILSKAVRTTMGPRGKTVLIERPGQHPIVTKDGVTVAQAVNLSKKFQNLGVQVVKEAAARSAEEAGDGTTTATVLTHAILEQGLRMISSGKDSVQLRKSIEKAVVDLLEILKKNSKDISNDEELKQIAMVSCNGEELIANLIVEALKSVGEDGSILVEEAKGYKSELTIVEGVRINRGFLSPYFVNDTDRMACQFDNPYIFIANKKIDSIKDIIKPLEVVLDTGKPILVIANELDNEAISGLVVNKTKGNLKVCAIKSPGFGSSQLEMLNDISCLTGAKVFGYSDDVSDLKIEDLGTCKKVLISRDSSLFLCNDDVKSKVKKRIHTLKKRLEDGMLENEEVSAIKYRIHQLTGGIAILRIGAATEAEMIERRDRVDDALHATRAAMQEGIVSGGGVALVTASGLISSKSEEDNAGYTIIKKACLEPMNQIVRNSGLSADLIVGKILEKNDADYGYDAREEKFGNMFELGIIDPLKVVRCAIQNASSAASLLLTSECAMVEIDENDK
jgi:chaperonin GroEL